MDFTSIFLKILPLYILIVIGFCVGRRTRIEASDLAVINLQLLIPMITFDAISHLPFAAENFIMPVTCFILLGILAVIVFNLTRWLSSDDKTPYWLSACCTTTNSGYFGIPVFIIAFGKDNLGLYMLYGLGATVFFYVVTTYLFIRSHYTLKQALGKVMRLPIIYAMIAGFICQAIDVKLPAVFDDFFITVRGAYVVMGMMIIGLVLGRQSEERKGFVFEWRLIAFSNVIRFAIFPLLALGVVTLDRHFFGLFSPMAEKIILLVSLMPMGADTTSLAAQWRMHPERIAALTLVNSVIALVVIPYALPLLLKF